ncbi:MAG TPA: hypothetical protein PLD10_15955 [Rhodopila sp.]|nr:hypothetical protein [Rhodopila sp.]
MQYVFTGQAWSFDVELDPPADVSSVSWTLRDGTGAPMASYTNIAVNNAIEAPSVAISTPGAANTKTASLGLSENRFLCVTWLVNGGSYQKVYPYKLVDFMPLLLDGDQIRSLAGMTEAELPDEEIDIPSAATTVRGDVGATVFDNALLAGDETTPLVNGLIAYRVLIDLAPSYHLRIAQVISAQQNRFQRFAGATKDHLFATFREEYSRLRILLTNQVPPTPVLFTTTRRGVDAIRGPLQIFPLLAASATDSVAFLSAAFGWWPLATDTTSASTLGGQPSGNLKSWVLSWGSGIDVTAETFTITPSAPAGAIIQSMDFQVGNNGGSFTAEVLNDGQPVGGLGAVIVNSSTLSNLPALNNQGVSQGTPVQIVVTQVTGTPQSAVLQINYTTP